MGIFYLKDSKKQVQNRTCFFILKKITVSIKIKTKQIFAIQRNTFRKSVLFSTEICAKRGQIEILGTAKLFRIIYKGNKERRRSKEPVDSHFYLVCNVQNHLSYVLAAVENCVCLLRLRDGQDLVNGGLYLTACNLVPNVCHKLGKDLRLYGRSS